MRIDDLLREVGETAPRECGPGLEARLREALRRRRRALWPYAAAAVAVAAGLLIALAPTPHPEIPAPAAVTEFQTEFFRLHPAAVPELPGAYVVRVLVPSASLASFGLPVSVESMDQRVEADLLVGGDGTAQAIRFVRRVE